MVRPRAATRLLCSCGTESWLPELMACSFINRQAVVGAPQSRPPAQPRSDCLHTYAPTGWRHHLRGLLPGIVLIIVVIIVLCDERAPIPSRQASSFFHRRCHLLPATATSAETWGVNACCCCREVAECAAAAKRPPARDANGQPEACHCLGQESGAGMHVLTHRIC